MLQLDITEVEHDNAIHGVLRTTAYELVGHTDESVTLSATIYAPNGYPFVVQTWVTYAITSEGLEVTHRLRNHSSSPAPVAVGTHAFFCIGDVPTSSLVLRTTARTVYVDDERHLPVRREPVSGERDLRAGARVGDLALDTCYTDLEFADGRSCTTLTAPDGRSVSVWTDSAFAYQVLLITGDFIADDGQARLAVAIEPQTAAVDAFNSRDGLHRLEGGGEWTVSWGVTPALSS